MSMDLIINRLNALKNKLEEVGGGIRSRLEADERTAWVAFYGQLALMLLPPFLAGLVLLCAKGKGVGWRAFAIGVAGILHLPAAVLLVGAWGVWTATDTLGKVWCWRRRRDPAGRAEEGRGGWWPW